MLLLWDNKADAATVTAGSQIGTLPGANVQQPHLSRQWQTAAGVKSSNLIFDMLASVSCSMLAVLGTNLTPAATMRLRASDLDPTVVANLLLDTGTVAAGVKAGYGAIYKQVALTAARYWRLDLTDNSVPDNLRVGRVVLGPSWTHAKALIYGWGVTPHDPSTVEESYGGQSYPDVRPQKRVLDFALDFLSESEIYDNAFALARAAGVVKDVLAIPRETGAYVSEQAVWGLIQGAKPIVHHASQLFRQQFTVKERL
jgi:hypothetical protein